MYKVENVFLQIANSDKYDIKQYFKQYFKQYLKQYFKQYFKQNIIKMNIIFLDCLNLY